MTLPWVRGLSCASFALAITSLLSGCTIETTAKSVPYSDPVTAISGTVHGGSQAIYGAKVYLLAVNPSGYGGPGLSASSSNASVSLLSPVVSTSVTPDSIGYYATTDSTTGGFSLSTPGEYNCSLGYTQGSATPSVTLSGSEQVYLYVLGGKAANITSANASSGLLVALGPCNSPTTQVRVNEMTTAATAYAFAGFATDATHIGSSGSTLALTNLANAFANVANLAVVSTGSGAASSGTIIRPLYNINTIANILAPCVDGLTANATCNALFQYTKSSGATGTAPTDTATAAINLAHNPWPTDAGMSALYALAPATGAPFGPGLSSQPNDFTLGLNISGGALNQPYAIAIDAVGNAWVPNYNGSSLSEFSNSGTPLSGTNGYTGGGLNAPSNLAIDTFGNVWAANYSTITKTASNGTPISNNPGFYGGGLTYPKAIAIDPSNNVWVSNSVVSSLSEFTNSGNAISTSNGYTGGGITTPYGVAIDASGNAWDPNYNASSLSEFSSSGNPLSPGSGYTGGGLNAPTSVAIDGAGNVWATSFSALSKFSSNGAPISSSAGYTGGGLSSSRSIAIDGAGTVWIANANTLSEFSSGGNPLSSPGGYYASGLFSGPRGIAIDGSGNVWTANLGSNSLTVLIGAGAPVVTPLAANFASPYAVNASTVNRP